MCPNRRNVLPTSSAVSVEALVALQVSPMRSLSTLTRKIRSFWKTNTGLFLDGGIGSGLPSTDGTSCSPSSAPQVKNGRCTSIAQLLSQCQAQRVSKSPNCTSSQFCCFSEDASANTTTSAPSGTVPSVTVTSTIGMPGFSYFTL